MTTKAGQPEKVDILADNRKGLSNRSVATTGAAESMSGGLTVKAEALAKEIAEAVDLGPYARAELLPLLASFLERHDAALREQVTREVGALWMETQRDELDTNLRIAERIGIIKAIKDGKSYEDAEVELFDSLRQAGEQLAEALERFTANYEREDDCACDRCEALGPARAALSSWRAVRGEQK